MDRTSTASLGQGITQLRCTVYARTSSRETQGAAYTSIDAQLDAGLAYIRSRAGIGWEFMGVTYSDAEISGAVLERPGLHRLMRDIESGKVNVVVTIKLDRISRRVKDFAQMMAFFERHGVALVSVTQYLNSEEAVGRLAINALVVFAEFERDIASERSRDKILATRRKGLWSGSVPPLGYVLNGQRLVVNDEEAALVRKIFSRFVALQSVSLLAQELTEQGVTTKTWVTRCGKARGGKPIDKTYIYKLLNNRMLMGELLVGDQWQPAAHLPIVDTTVWNEAHALLSARRRPPKRTSLTVGGADFLLRGRVFGEDGRAFSPWTSSLRGNRVYKYYVAQKDIAVGGGASGLPRLQAYSLEQQVRDHVYHHLSQPATVLRELPACMTQHPDYSEQHFSEALARIAELWPSLFSTSRDQIVRRVLNRVIVHRDGITIRLEIEGFVGLISEVLQGEGQPRTIRDIFERASSTKTQKRRS